MVIVRHLLFLVSVMLVGGGVDEGWCINVHVLGLHLLSTIARYHWLPSAGGDKLVKGIFEEELTVEEPISASAFTI
jgi:hypothetical protein